MTDELRAKMQTLMYRLTKNAARYSYDEFLKEECGITWEEYEEIKKEWKEKLGIEPYV